MKILEADIKEFRYDEAIKPSLKNISFSACEGEIIVITGLSGSGKTTFLRVLNGLIPYHYDGDLKGSVKLYNKNINEYKIGELAKYIGNVFQTPSDQFFAIRADEEVAFVGENLGMEVNELSYKVKSAFSKLGIEHLMNRKLSDLSGGEKQKVAIASTLVYDTKIIFFDEPSASIDNKGIQGFKEILIDLKAEGKTIIIAEHRLFFLKDLYDELIYMKEGGIEKIFKKSELTNLDCCNYGLRRLNYYELECNSILNLGNTVHKLENINVLVDKKNHISNISFELKENEIMAIIGENGAGKTSLLRTLSGLTGGKQSISYGEKEKSRLKKTYYMLQDVDYQIFFDTVENELVPKKKMNDEKYLDNARNCLKTIDLWEKRTEHPQTLSVGEKQRLALGISFLSDKEIIILDEPTSGLDYLRMKMIRDIILKLSKSRPILIATHDVELIFEICNTILIIKNSKCMKMNVKGNKDYILEILLDSR